MSPGPLDATFRGISPWQFELVLDSMLEPMAIFKAVRDDSGQIIDLEWIYANEAGARDVLLPIDQLVGHRLCEVLPGHRDYLLGRYAAVIETGEPFVAHELGFDDTWGTQEVIPRVYNVRGFKINDGLAVSWNDVTDQVIARRQIEQINEQLVAAQEELARSNRELEQYAYTASHDLQAPLRSIAGLTELIKDDGVARLTDEQQRHLTLISQYAERGRDQVRGLLEMARLQASGGDPVPVDVAEQIRQVDLTLHRQPTDVLEIGADLPIVLAEPDHVRLLLSNLIGNGLKYHPSGEHAYVTVQRGSSERPGYEAVIVRDRGIGIAESDRRRVFELFRRLNPDHQYPGTGIGLALVAKVVDLHHGVIWIDTPADGVGTEVHVELPGLTVKAG